MGAVEYFLEQMGNPTNPRLVLIANVRAWLSINHDHMYDLRTGREDEEIAFVNSMDLDRYLVSIAEEITDEDS